MDKEGMHKNKSVECRTHTCKDNICWKMFLDHITKASLALLWKFRRMALIVTFFPQSKPIPTLHIMMRTEFIIWGMTGRSSCLLHLSSHKKGKIDSKTTWKEVKERKIEVLLESLLMFNSTNLKNNVGHTSEFYVNLIHTSHLKIRNLNREMPP